MKLQRRVLDTELSLPPSSSSSPPSSSHGNTINTNNTTTNNTTTNNSFKTHDSSFINEANFDTNMVIILAALLCALICALGLNSIARCALRCGRRFSPGSPDQAAARLAMTGLKKSHLRRIPVAVYGSREEIPATECPICLGEFEKGDKVRMLPQCKHGFHVRCIDTWLLSHSSCPNCRQSLLEGLNKIGCSSSEGSGGGGGAAVPENGSGERGGGGSVVVVVDQAS